VLYYGLIIDIPEEGLEYTGELTYLPFSSAEPPYTRKNADETVDYLDWICILETTDEP